MPGGFRGRSLAPACNRNRDLPAGSLVTVPVLAFWSFSLSVHGSFWLIVLLISQVAIWLIGGLVCCFESRDNFSFGGRTGYFVAYFTLLLICPWRSCLLSWSFSFWFCHQAIELLKLLKVKNSHCQTVLHLPRFCALSVCGNDGELNCELWSSGYVLNLVHLSKQIYSTGNTVMSQDDMMERFGSAQHWNVCNTNPLILFTP